MPILTLNISTHLVSALSLNRKFNGVVWYNKAISRQTDHLRQLFETKSNHHSVNRSYKMRPRSWCYGGSQTNLENMKINKLIFYGNVSLRLLKSEVEVLIVYCIILCNCRKIFYKYRRSVKGGMYSPINQRGPKDRRCETINQLGCSLMRFVYHIRS